MKSILTGHILAAVVTLAFAAFIVLGVVIWIIDPNPLPTSVGFVIFILLTFACAYFLVKNVSSEIVKTVLKIVNFDWGGSGTRRSRKSDALISTEQAFVEEILVPYGKDPFFAELIKLVLRAKIREGNMKEVEKLTLEIRDSARSNTDLIEWLKDIRSEACNVFKKELKGKAPKYDRGRTVGENMAKMEDFLKEHFAPFLTITEGWFSLNDQYGIEEMFRGVPQESLGIMLNELGRRAESFFPSHKPYLHEQAKVQLLEMFQRIRIQVLKPVPVE